MNPFDKYLNETLNSLNERSINKIQAEFSEVVGKMSVLAKEYAAAEGDEKTNILAELKGLTSKKNDLVKELDNAVAGKDKDVQLAIKESEVTEAYGKSAGLTKEETMEVAQKFADAMSKADGTKVTVNKRTLEEDSFDLDVDGEEFDGGSYNIYQNGNVMNMALRNNPVYGKKNDSVDTIVKNLKKLQESVTNEANLVLGLSTNNYPAGTIGRYRIESTVINLRKVADLSKDSWKKYSRAFGDNELGFEKSSDRKEALAAIQKSFDNGQNDLREFELNESIVDEGFENSAIQKALKDCGYDLKQSDFKLSKKKQSGAVFYYLNGEIIGNDDYGYDKLVQKATERIKENPKKYGLNESTITEGKVTLKRRYTENHPAITVGKNAKIRNKVIEAIKDGKISQEQFDNIVSELSNRSKNWTRNNSQYFTVSEDGVSLSNFGKKILSQITVNETVSEKLDYKKLAKQFVNDEWLDADDNIDDADEYFDDKLNAFNREELGNSKEFDNNKTDMSIEVKKLLKGKLKQIFEATKKNPEIWVPGGFDKEIGKYPNSKITREIVLKAAKKWDVNDDEAIAYVEFGWDLDLNENKTNNMKTKFIYESFQEFVENKLNESTLNEAFASLKLASILTGANKMDKDLPSAFYNMSKLALDKIQDIDIIEMTPEQAKKEKRSKAVYFYFTTNEKENPYAGRSSWSGEKTIPANTLLAITDGSNEWMATGWQKFYSKDKKATRTLKTAKRDDSAGFPKSGARSEYGSGISSMKQVVDLADRAYCLDLDVLRARYSTESQRVERTAARKGATAFMNDKEFKETNKKRYYDILATKASAMPMDTIVLDAIEKLGNQIKDAIANGTKGKYDDILIGLDPKGKEVKLNDASNLMRNILDEYSRYVADASNNEKEKAAGYTGNYYEGSMKNRAKNINDSVKKIENKNYAW